MARAEWDILKGQENRDPLDWYIEVCKVCGGQLGPGCGSLTRTGRCVEEDHRSIGGIIVRVMARHPIEQDDITRRFQREHPSIAHAENTTEVDG